MIGQREVAGEINQLMIECSGKLDDSIALIQEKCTTAEFEAYRRAASVILMEMFSQIMTPIYRRHPDLQPEGLKRPRR